MWLDYCFQALPWNQLIHPPQKDLFSRQSAFLFELEAQNEKGLSSET